MSRTDTKQPTTSQTPAADMNPGDQVPPGSPQSGENVCPDCGGSGRQANDSRCPNCGGTGKVIELVGDA